jgi:hypothetical protein
MSPIGPSRNWQSIFMDYWAAHKAGLALRTLTNIDDQVRPLHRPIDEHEPPLPQAESRTLSRAYRAADAPQTSDSVTPDQLSLGGNGT